MKSLFVLLVCMAVLWIAAVSVIQHFKVSLPAQIERQSRDHSSLL